MCQHGEIGSASQSGSEFGENDVATPVLVTDFVSMETARRRRDGIKGSKKPLGGRQDHGGRQDRQEHFRPASLRANLSPIPGLLWQRDPATGLQQSRHFRVGELAGERCPQQICA
jgi:hypothetical protein